jgi:hypothetical protein
MASCSLPVTLQSENNIPSPFLFYFCSSSPHSLFPAVHAAAHDIVLPVPAHLTRYPTQFRLDNDEAGPGTSHSDQMTATNTNE